MGHRESGRGQASVGAASRWKKPHLCAFLRIPGIRIKIQIKIRIRFVSFSWPVWVEFCGTGLWPRESECGPSINREKS